MKFIFTIITCYFSIHSFLIFYKKRIYSDSINLELEDQLLGSKLIIDLAQTYVDAARLYREKKLQEGIEFINNTKPNFEEELEKLDKKYRYLEEKYILIQEGSGFSGSEFGITNLVSKYQSKLYH